MLRRKQNKAEVGEEYEWREKQGRGRLAKRETKRKCRNGSESQWAPSKDVECFSLKQLSAMT